MRYQLMILTGIIFPVLIAAQQPVNIIPQPVSIQIEDGSFLIDRNTSLHFNTADASLASAGQFFIKSLSQLSGIQLPVNKVSGKTIHIKLVKQAGLGEEGYHIKVSPQSIIIEANRAAGIIYGIQSLLQTLPAVRTNAPLAVPAMTITDYPRFKWRGMHLDVSRHFFSADMVKEYIDLMATYKMNSFHWHLVDDQGWRIQIKKYPKLTETGAWREDHLDKPWDDRPVASNVGTISRYGGYYTQEQIKDIVAYASQRNITIVPEIEMPGHVASAIAAYPYLSCAQLAQSPVNGGNYLKTSSNYCAGNDSVFVFLRDVLTEVLDLFPSQYIHVGGDEVNKSGWKACSKCQLRMKKENLNNEEELQSYFIKRIGKFLKTKNRKLLGWDEILEGGLPSEAAVMSWRGEKGGIEAARLGHNVVMTPGNPCYFDFYQSGPEGEPIAIGGMNTLKDVYSYDPVPRELKDEEVKFVLGAQANVWTEFIASNEHLEYMVLPRMPALSEVLWTPPANKNWEGFYTRVQSHFKRYEQKGLRYSRGNFTVSIKPGRTNGQIYTTLTTEIPGAEIYYTVDGTPPSIYSNKYNNPIIIDASCTLKASTAVDKRIKSVIPSTADFTIHKAVGREVNYTYPVSKQYSAGGTNALTDGIRAKSNSYSQWHGFKDNDLLATIDLGKEQTIKRISLGCLQKYTDWIFLPEWVKVETSADGKSYKMQEMIKNPVNINNTDILVFDFTTTFAPELVRYIRITAKNNLCPPGHGGAGTNGWLFADEVIVE